MLVELNTLQNGTLAKKISHHAILLTSRVLASQGLGEDGEDGGLPFSWFAAVASQFCGINFQIDGLDNEGLWQRAASHSDVFIADRTRAILRLEEVAALNQLACYPPLVAKRRLFFIDRASRLNLHATNSLLKLLEEPQIPCLFLLTANRITDVLPTIVSRCFRLQAKIEHTSEKNVQPELEAEDWQQISQHLLQTVRRPTPAPLGNSMWASGTSLPTTAATTATMTTKATIRMANQIQDVVSLADRLSKQYEDDVLQGAITRFVAETWKHDEGGVASNPQARAQMRFILSDLREWRRAAPYHPSAAHWLSRILLKGVV